MARTPKYLLANDSHISKDNIQEFKRNWKEMLEVANEYDIQRIVIGGDLWQSRSAQTLETLLAVQEVFDETRKANLGLVLISGNHDRVDQEDYRSYNHIFYHHPAVDIIDIDSYLLLDQRVVLWLISYFPENGSFTKHLKNITETLNPDFTNLLYCHEGIRGGLSTSSDDELPASIFKPFDKVLVGHYHDRKKITGTNIEYIGASRQHNFGEDEEKGYTIVYSDGSTKFIKNEVNIRYKVIDVNYADMDDELLDEIKRLKADGRYKIKVRVNCKSKEAKIVDKQKLAEVGASKVELVTEQTELRLTESQSIDKKFDKTGIKQEYATFCSERSINTEMGLQYLDKIN